MGVGGTNHDQFRPPLGNPECPCDLHGGSRAALGASGCTDDGQLVQTGFGDQLGFGSPWGGVDLVSEAHTTRVSNLVTDATHPRLVFLHGHWKSNQMNKNWPEQEFFCMQVEAFAEEHGFITPRGSLMLEPLSKLFECSPTTLKQWLQNKKRPRPHFDSMEKVASVVGCDPSQFMGGAPPVEGVFPTKMKTTSRNDKALFNRLLSGLMSLPEGDREKFVNHWLQLIELSKPNAIESKKSTTNQ